LRIAFETIGERQIAANAMFLPGLGNDKTQDDSPVGVRPKGLGLALTAWLTLFGWPG